MLAPQSTRWGWPAAQGPLWGQRQAVRPACWPVELARPLARPARSSLIGLQLVPRPRGPESAHQPEEHFWGTSRAGDMGSACREGGYFTSGVSGWDVRDVCASSVSNACNHKVKKAKGSQQSQQDGSREKRRRGDAGAGVPRHRPLWGPQRLQPSSPAGKLQGQSFPATPSGPPPKSRASAQGRFAL